MKINILSILLLLNANLIFGQTPKNVISIEDKEFNKYFQKKESIPTVKGKVLNVTQEDIEKAKITYSIVTPFKELLVKKSCTLNSDGTFELELDYAFPFQQIWISVGRLFYAGIYAHTDLYIELDAEILKSQKGVKNNGLGIKYLGQDGELNTFLNNNVLFNREKKLEISMSISAIKREKKLDFDSFMSKYDSLYSILNEIDNEFIKLNPSQYSWLISNERQSDYYAYLCFKHWRKEMTAELFEKVKSHKSYLTSISGMEFYKYLFDYLSINSKKRRKPIDYGIYRNYSKLEEANKSILDSILIINKGISQKQIYDTAKYISLIKQANNFLHDTLVIINTFQTIKYLDNLFDNSKSDFLKIKISSKDPNEQRLMTEIVLGNIQTEWCKKVIQEQSLALRLS